MKSPKDITVTKAKVHNLKNITIKIPKNTLTIITGPSGSGKSSLAFDTIYVEGQRRYIESLSSYARQFLGQYQPPDVESITGLSPAIAIDQKTSSKNPRSTVGTVTEIYDYLRVLFARAGTLYCLDTNEVIRKYTPTQIAKEVMEYENKTRIQILAPIISNEKGDFSGILSKYLGMGFTRIVIDGKIETLSDELKIPKNKKVTLEIVVDRVAIKEGVSKRLTESIEHALKLGQGNIRILANDESLLFSEHNTSSSGRVYPELEPRLFSFNSPLGACENCNGIGLSKSFDYDLMILDDGLSMYEGAIKACKKSSFLFKMIESIADHEGVDLELPFKKLPKKFKDIILNGSDYPYRYNFYSAGSKFYFTKAFPGMSKWLEKKYNESGSENTRATLETFMRIKECDDCNGKRLNPVALSTKINKTTIIDICELSVEDAHTFIAKVKLKGEQKIIAEKLLKEISTRLKFLIDVGLEYLTLNRGAMSLSGGESQRIRLATQIGSALSGVLYVLDEPSIGLHQRDNTKLIKTLKSLRDIGNTVLVVEHDEETMMESDYIIDIGPGAGINGGNIVAHGPVNKFIKNKKSITAKYLNGTNSIPTPKERRKSKSFIKLKGATANNLKKVNIDIPTDGLTCVSGVSGSGKSSLIHEVLVPAVKNYLGRERQAMHKKANYQSISGVDKFKTIIELDQSPIGRTPHSNPATYTKLFDSMRTLYSKTPESQIRGYKPGRFSFNVKGGRCEECEGNGVKKIEMHFLPDVYITFTECNGSRYNRETLSILYRGKNISDVLKMSISEALAFFQNHPKIARTLKTLDDVGLGYMKLGQPATTLSGGEAQRLKLSRELAKRTKGKCLYVLDEPTTGLHFEDVKILLKAINQLVEQDHAVLIIEHNLDVIKSADYVVDLGPEGGFKGGEIIAKGTPEDIAKNKKSYTGKYLKKILK